MPTRSSRTEPPPTGSWRSAPRRYTRSDEWVQALNGASSETAPASLPATTAIRTRSPASAAASQPGEPLNGLRPMVSSVEGSPSILKVRVFERLKSTGPRSTRYRSWADCGPKSVNVPSPLYCGAQALIWSATAETTRALIRACIGGGLTVKLRGRPEAPDQAPRAHNVSRARGADTQTVHGPLQRLLDSSGVSRSKESIRGSLGFGKTLAGE